MERNTRSIVPPMNNHVKPRNNGPISPRERDMNNSSYHQPPHYNNNSNPNHNSSSSNQQAPSPNSELINFVSGAWKEKMTSEVFKSENTEKKHNPFDLDGWLRTRQN